MRTVSLCFLTVLAALLTPVLARAANWADDPAAYLSSPAGRYATIGQSHGPCLSAAEAEAQAMDDAAKQLVYPRVSVRAGRSREALMESVRNAMLVRDRSVKVVHKPYGDIWSAAVLVDASPAQISQQMTLLALEQKEQRRRRAAGAAGIIIVVGLAYLVANAVTRGYFRRRLRFLAVAACLVPALLMWAGH
jgi:hypothetical protein